MSYTRRMGNFSKSNIPLSSVGQRRPMPNAFNNIGENKQQLHPHQHQHHQQNQPQQQYQSQMQQQEKPKGVPQPQANQQSKLPQLQDPQQPLPLQQGPTNMQQVAEQMVAEHSFVDEQKPLLVGPPEIPGMSNYGIADCNDIIIPKTKPFWMKRNGRINKAERARRRNVRLRKLLQPKNALMIINELVGAVAFDLSETKNGYEDVYKASVNVDGTEYVGYGKSKAIAKTTAAESAVRAMILKKLKITAQIVPVSEENKEDVKMELVTEENQDDVSWTHIASFAIHKLFSSWGDEGNMADMISRASSVGSLHEGSVKEDSVPGIQTQPEQKPAKRLPENAALMNPIMLLNQMHPSAKYEELGKSGVPPHIQFTIRCLVGTHAFVGIGQNKKAARKQAAFEACRTLLDIQYPPEVVQGMSANKPVPMETP